METVEKLNYLLVEQNERSRIRSNEREQQSTAGLYTLRRFSYVPVKKKEKKKLSFRSKKLLKFQSWNAPQMLERSKIRLYKYHIWHIPFSSLFFYAYVQEESQRTTVDGDNGSV